MNLKTKLLFSFLMIGSLLLVNCQVEDLQESASKRNPYTPIVSKEFKEFEKLLGILSEIIPNHGLSVRNKNTDPRYQFEIDSTAVIQITNNGIAYYTMSITRENQEDGVFENLVVFDDGNEKKAIIVKYKPDASFLSRFELNPDTQFSGKFNMTELGHSNLASRLTSATKCFISTHLYCTNNNPPTLAGKGCYTNKDGGAHVKSITSVNCFEIIINEPEPYLNNTFVLNPINDAGGGNPDIATSIATHPVFMGIIDFRFLRRLTPEQKAWWNNASNNESVAAILNYLKENMYGSSLLDINNEAIVFARQLIQASIDTGLTFNVEKSIDSPFNIDMSLVSGNSPEEIRFNKIYDKLRKSFDFRYLFVNIFNTTNFINAKFAIANIPQDPTGYIAGDCRLTRSSFGGLSNTIRIDKTALQTYSDSRIALIILHECIHAYLNIKLAHPNIAMDVDTINNLNLVECINTNYNGFTNRQDQHDFFVDYMIPTMVGVLTSIKDELFTPTQIYSVENPQPNSYVYATTPTIPSVKNFSQVVPWSWQDYFRHLSYDGLQLSRQFPLVYPTGSQNSLNWEQYISIGVLNFNP